VLARDQTLPSCVGARCTDPYTNQSVNMQGKLLIIESVNREWWLYVCGLSLGGGEVGGRGVGSIKYRSFAHGVVCG